MSTVTGHEGPQTKAAKQHRADIRQEAIQVIQEGKAKANFERELKEITAQKEGRGNFVEMFGQRVFIPYTKKK